ncbi:MAG: hypothetical protein DWH70_01070 [Planctomycetota bacterium]|nr:MAG: hypothetical protein DWH70_01070 [Planctomycetota bacterium]
MGESCHTSAGVPAKFAQKEAPVTKATAVIWVKRDARLTDNPCLVEADRLQLNALPFFCFEPSLSGKP